jgi:hypothetical protein
LGGSTLGAGLGAIVLGNLGFYFANHPVKRRVRDFDLRAIHRSSASALYRMPR